MSVPWVCFGLRRPWPNGYSGWLNRGTYPDQNLVSITTGGLDATTYAYFFDATTHELVGATRTNSWKGLDPIYCSQDSGSPTDYWGKYTTVRAGRLPNCEDSNCLANTGQQLCPPPEAGVPEGGALDVDDASPPPPDSTDADLTDTAKSAEASADAPDDTEARSDDAPQPTHAIELTFAGRSEVATRWQLCQTQRKWFTP